jgi:hypothetical protein
VRLYDLRIQALAAHLSDLIDLLAPRSLEASWIVSSPASIAAVPKISNDNHPIFQQAQFDRASNYWCSS